MTRSSPVLPLTSTQPEHATHASTHDDDPRNDGSMDAPQERHTMHASVAQADVIKGLLANANSLTCSNVGQPRSNIEKCS